MRRRSTLGLVALLGLGLVGCYTGITGREVSEDDKTEEGLRYYLPQPLLVIEELPNGQWDARVAYAINRSKAYRVQPVQYLARSTATIEFNSDGTLKSFQLNQNSGDVPEAFIAGFKDVAVKKLELEKEAMEAQVKQAGEDAKKSGAKQDGAAPALESRRVYVFPIAGKDGITWKDEPVAKMELGPAAAPKPELKLELSSDKKEVVLSRPGNALGTSDIQKLTFLDAGGKAVSDADTKALRTKATKGFDPIAGTITFEKTDLSAKKIAKIALDDDTKDVP